ncbi:hotdog fold thioesterase [Halovenus sp. WSH3]|uniref:Hotdog fold thioesterase n=1 Tax=Halovenus carboxidivorans TaxID=2692199 RepID=A0A6B0T2L0_9EURY|nr:PaaI family thioesterase [Halovenus carboxidivorans]MXR52478.1 hotdog fold thioesterase [Halovenus carboxidivorans]
MDEDVLDSVQAVIDDHDFLSWLGVEVTEFEEGRAVLSMPHDQKLTNIVEGSRGTIHGGVTASLVDTASGFALRTTFADPTAPALTTTDLDVTYLRPARSDLTVEAEVVRAGESMGFTDVTVFGETPGGERKAVVKGSASYRLFRESQ